MSDLTNTLKSKPCYDRNVCKRLVFHRRSTDTIAPTRPFERQAVAAYTANLSPLLGDSMERNVADISSLGWNEEEIRTFDSTEYPLLIIWL
jgi:hypothetical protein